MTRRPLLSIALGLLVAGCHDDRTDDANTTLAVDDTVVAANPLGEPPYFVFCASKDPTQDPIIALIGEWPDKPIKPPKGYKKCTVRGAV